MLAYIPYMDPMGLDTQTLGWMSTNNDKSICGLGRLGLEVSEKFGPF